MTSERIEASIHYAAAFIGGCFGMYAITVRSMFGSAETMNMLSLVEDLLGRNIPDFLARFAALLIFSSGVVISISITDRMPRWRNIIAFLSDSAAVLIMGILPQDVDNIVALYPVFLATAMQWCLIKGPYGYTVSSIFSTNNLRQFLTGIVRKIEKKDEGKVSRMHVFGMTLLCFHAGAAAEYIAVEHLYGKGIWLAVFPLILAFVLSLLLLRCKE